jgi:transcriptional regulator with XRE-family HTH domain
MVNRVKKMLEIEQLSPSQFADEIKLQRSSLSHVLSGRNKPSLDFVMKIKQRFSEVNLDWLIFGEGNMFISHQVVDDAKSISVKDESKNEDNQQSINFDSKSISSITEKDVENEKATAIIEPIKVKTQSGSANKVMIFYNNGTFDEYVSN